MDLADRLIAKKERNPYALDSARDDIGIPIPPQKSIDYFCARVLKQHPGIYKFRGKLYEEHCLITEDRKTLISYNGEVDKFINSDNTVLIWDRIRTLVPELSFDKIKISSHLMWDIKKGELEWQNT